MKKQKMRKVYYNQEYGEFKKIAKLGEVEEEMSDFIPFEERLEELEKDQLQKLGFFLLSSWD